MYQSFSEIRRDAESCEKCDLAKTRKHVLFGEGGLAVDIMFVGEGPGAREDETGRPFVGPAGQLLDKMLAAIGLDRTTAYIANVVKCRPPHNADPKPEYCKACIGYLREQVRFLRPKIIVCLGRIAMGQLLGETQGITRVHGRVYQRKGFYLVPTFHPSALLRNPDLKRDAWEDFKVIRSLLEEVRSRAENLPKTGQ